VDYPEFPEAVCRLQRFLRDCKVPENIDWVRFSNVAWVGGRLYIWPLPRDRALAFARAEYECALNQRPGVMLAALGRAGATVYCYVYQPSSKVEAEYRLMPDGLKLSVPTPLWEATVVCDQSQWQLLQGQEQDLHLKRSLFE
jgi:hypothetical protein